jgi:hypothetical protein
MSLAAKETVLSIVTNDEEISVYKLIAQTDQDDRMIKNIFRDEYVKGSLVERRTLDLNAINSDGMVIKEDKVRKMVILKLVSDNFDFERGGVVTMDTLYNGITGVHKFYEFEILKDRLGFILLKDKKTVTKMHMVSNRLPVVGAVGVADVQVLSY